MGASSNRAGRQKGQTDADRSGQRHRSPLAENDNKRIPDPAVQRLSLYLRQLERLAWSDRKTISSRQLGDALRITDAQVRKDLAYFGQFGSPGIGYSVPDLIRRLRRILGTDRVWNVVLIGMGNLGSALTAYRGFERKGFKLVAVFDNDETKLGRPVPWLNDVCIQPLRELSETVQRHDIRLGIIAVPADAGQAVADRLIEAGVTGILNFAPMTLNTPAAVEVLSVDMAVMLEQLSFRVGASLEAGRGSD
ncbi:MAG: redox-sensing transcriptional repressor Rex [Phycisphaerae bacterium]|nr:redox-sensing transcriptional repressor Rex [Phycisphaerae bacterium]NUQ47175.1 redox-sensing transcriptional repressor Rex [Phycisphaerae bacterium]